MGRQREAVKTSMKSIESGVWASILGCIWDMVFEPFWDALGYMAGILSEMALHVQSHVPDPILVSEMEGQTPHP